MTSNLGREGGGREGGRDNQELCSQQSVRGYLYHFPLADFESESLITACVAVKYLIR